jgi:hypothetical protein
LGFGHGVAVGAEDHKSGEVVVFRSQTISDPGAHTRPNQLIFPAIHEHQRRFVVGYVRLHGPNDAQVIGMLGHMGEEFADRQSRLAMALEGQGGAKGGAGLAFGFEAILLRQKISMPLIEFGLRVEGIHVGGTAVHE